MRSKHNLPSVSAPWTSREAVKLVGIPGNRASDRMLDVLNVMFSIARNQQPSVPTTELIKGMWANISQSVHRKPMTNGFCGSMARSSLMYSFEHDHLLSGRGAMLAMGHAAQSVSILSDSRISPAQWRDLAGEGYSVPILAVISIALFTANAEDDVFW